MFDILLSPRFFLQWLEHFVKFVVILNVETNKIFYKGVEPPMNLQSIIPWKKEERSLAPGRGNGDDPFAQLQRRMNSVFEDFFGRSSSDLWGDTTVEFLPRVDVTETGKEVRITAELPGLDEKDVEG